MRKSWKTTTLGVLAIVSAAIGAVTALINGTPVDWTTVVASIMAGVGLLAARDNKVTSEQAGAK